MPYCRKCGKKIENDDGYCEECRNRDLIFGSYETSGQSPREEEPSTSGQEKEDEKEQCVVPAQVTEEKPDEPTGRMDGFGFALTSAILGTVALGMLMCVFQLILLAIGSGSNYGAAAIVTIPFAVIGIILSIPPAIIGLVFGIKSIKTFAANKRSGRALPIATLVLGIYGVVNTAVALLVLAIMSLIFGIV